MFVISIGDSKLSLLSSGVPVRINGHATMLRRDRDYLCYQDEDGMENRCKILGQTDLGDKVRFECASHGMEQAEHVIIAPNSPRLYYWMTLTNVPGKGGGGSSNLGPFP